MVGDDTLDQQKARTYIKRVKRNKECIAIQGVLFEGSEKIDIQQLNFLLINRKSKKEVIVKCHAVKLKNESILFEVTLDLNNQIFESSTQEEVFDTYLSANEGEIKIRIGNPSFWAKNKIKDIVFKKDNGYTCCLTPYYTFKENNLSFKLNTFDNLIYSYMKKIMFFSFFYRLIYKRRNVWILGELNYRAQDNAMVLYNYLRENHKNLNVYYVINKQSKDRQNLNDQTNIINFGSKKHILYTIIANRIITTHHPDYIYPTSMIKFKKKVQGRKLFLTHGVFGIKNMYRNYGNYINGFKVDHIITTSEQEKETVVNDLKYKKSQVSVTGMPRLDKLFISDLPSERAILIMPTWRDWLITKEPFEESEYYQRYLSVIQSSFLEKLCARHNVKLTFCLHPNFRMYTKYFSSSFAEVIYQGEANIQNLIKTHSLMVTDYSSVAFDFSFLNKPVIFYGFDLERFINEKTPHIDISKGLPGDLTDNYSDLIQLIEHYIENDFLPKEEHRIKSNKLLKYRDLNSSNRVYNVAKTIKKSTNRKLDNIPAKVFLVMFKKIFNRSI